MSARNRAALTDVLLACSYSSMWQLTSRTSFLQNSACSSPTEADGLWFVICFSFWTMSTPGVVGLRALTYKNFEASDTIPERSHMCDLILICCVMGNNFHETRQAFRYFFGSARRTQFLKHSTDKSLPIQDRCAYFLRRDCMQIACLE